METGSGIPFSAKPATWPHLLIPDPALTLPPSVPRSRIAPFFQRTAWKIDLLDFIACSFDPQWIRRPQATCRGILLRLLLTSVANPRASSAKHTLQCAAATGVASVR